MKKCYAKLLLLLPGVGILATGPGVLTSRAVSRSHLVCSSSFIYTAHLYADTVIRGKVTEVYKPPLSRVAVNDGDTTALLRRDTVFQVLYGRQSARTSIASLSGIQTAALSKTYTNNLYGMLAGRMAGLQVTQANGQPAYEAYSAILRGKAPMIMIDGSPARNMISINPEQIASVTLLKDALATAMYGMRAANGILLITTRKGEEGPQRLSFTATAGITKSTKMIRGLGAYDYARLYNEALANDGKPAAYTAADLDAYRNGSDPYGHPDVDWRKEVLKNSAPFQRYDVAISGGRENARYFVNLDYTNQTGLFKTNSINKYNTNADMKRYIFRSNVDVKINRSISASLNLMGRIQNNNEPGGFSDDIMTAIFNTPNSAYPIRNPDGSLAGNNFYPTNIYGRTVMAGYYNLYSRDLNADLAIKGDLSDLAKGLWVKGNFSFYTNFTEAIVRTKTNAVYSLRVNPGGDTTYLKYGNDGDMTNGTASTATERFLYSDVQLGYDRQFGPHALQVVYTVNNDNRILGNQLPQYFLGTAGRLAYNYRERYLFEFAMGYNGTNRYSKQRRYGWFPAFGIGWNLARESFLQTSWLDELKLRSSYGWVGNAFNGNRFSGTGEGYFVYNQYYEGGTGYNFGATATGVSGVREGRLANPYVTWEKARKFNVGMDVRMLSGRLSFTAEYYKNRYYDQLITRGNATALLGTTYPTENLGISDIFGTEFSLFYQHQQQQFHYYIGGNLNFVQQRLVYEDEPSKPYPWLVRTGSHTFITGYVSDGLFQSKEEIARSAKPDGYDPVPGDIKYKDLNGDGRINAFDQTNISPDKPQLFFGVNAGFSWKGFDCNILVQGTGNRYSLFQLKEFDNEGRGNAWVNHLERWTPETAATATYPRLSVGSNFNNDRVSDYWMRKTSYWRLKNVELGYTLPTALIRRLRISSLRVFVNGTNLFTHSTIREADPENLYGNYPIQQAFMAGLNLKF